MMKKGFFLVTCTALMALLSTAEAGQPVTIAADEAYPPYSYVDAGKAMGIYPRILAAVFARMPDYDVTLQPLPWKRALKETEDGAVLGVIPPYYRPKDRAWMQYSDMIYEEKIVVYCKNDIAEKLAGKTFPTDFAGLTFGNNAGFLAGGEAFTAMGKSGALKIEEAASTEQNLRKLAAGRIDCYLNDGNSIEWEWNKLAAADHGLQRNFKPAATAAAEKAFLGLTGTDKFPFKEKFVKEFNESLAALKASGDLDHIVAGALKQ